MHKVTFRPVNAIHGRVETTEPSILMSLREHYSYEVPGAVHSPLYKQKLWDGMIHLFGTKNRLLYRGLEQNLAKYCEDHGLEFEATEPLGSEPISELESDAFIQSLNIPLEFESREYQVNAFRKGIEAHRALFLSPTSSGKSFLIYLLLKWFNKKTLVIVPTTTLVHQLSGDFVSYGMGEGEVHKISGGERWTTKDVTVSTWQSAVKMNQEWFDQFEVVIGDEAHRFAAKSLTKIMESLRNCNIRLGFTGSLDGSKANAMVLEGLFGPVMNVITTKELMDQGFVSNLKVEVLVLKHPDLIRKAKRKYKEEIDFLYQCEARNKFICDLASGIEGNTLILYHIIKHGKMIFDELRSRYPNREIFFVHGGVRGDVRNDIRGIVENENDAIIVASTGTFSTGISIKRLHNIISASSWKSRIMNLQSIGRGLRMADDKFLCTLYDVVDDLSWKKRLNYTLQHSHERIHLYNEQVFEYERHRIILNY